MNDIEKNIRDRLKETGKNLSDDQIDDLVKRIEGAGILKMALIGEAAMNAEEHQAAYSPVKHLKALGK